MTASLFLYRITYGMVQREVGEIKIDATSRSAAEKRIKEMAAAGQIPLKEGFSFDGVRLIQ